VRERGTNGRTGTETRGLGYRNSNRIKRKRGAEHEEEYRYRNQTTRQCKKMDEYWVIEPKYDVW